MDNQYKIDDILVQVKDFLGNPIEPRRFIIKEVKYYECSGLLEVNIKASNFQPKDIKYSHISIPKTMLNKYFMPENKLNQLLFKGN